MHIPLPPPPLTSIQDSVDREQLTRLLQVSPLVNGKYLHWDKVRHRQPPEGLSHDEWWLGIKLARNQLLKPLPLRDRNDANFFYGTPDPLLRMLHEIDQQASGTIQIAKEVTNQQTRDRYIISSLIEEAINSSQLEGASTTADVAKQMLRTGRRPVNRSEQMIVNNYAAMHLIRDFVDQPLTPQTIFNIHRVLTENTMDGPEQAGTLRTTEDDIQVVDETGTVLHVPPPADELPRRIRVMCDFANNRSTETFLHPVVRAIALHFWVGYDHPFVDGNGRTARALFYRSMLSQGYWLAEYLSVSRILKAAPSQYACSFLYTETDDNDLTYFLEYHLSVIRRAIDELRAFLDRKTREVRVVKEIVREAGDLNHRQLAVLGHALRHPGARYTIESHKNSHNVVYQTARTDLLRLAEMRLLTQWKSGRSYQFAAPRDLATRLESVASRRLAALGGSDTAASSAHRGRDSR